MPKRTGLSQIATTRWFYWPVGGEGYAGCPPARPCRIASICAQIASAIAVDVALPGQGNDEGDGAALSAHGVEF